MANLGFLEFDVYTLAMLDPPKNNCSEEFFELHKLQYQAWETMRRRWMRYKTEWLFDMHFKIILVLTSGLVAILTVFVNLVRYGLQFHGPLMNRMIQVRMNMTSARPPREPMTTPAIGPFDDPA